MPPKLSELLSTICALDRLEFTEMGAGAAARVSGDWVSLKGLEYTRLSSSAIPTADWTAEPFGPTSSYTADNLIGVLEHV